MSDLNITIKGLALCRPMGSVTQILFPHAPKHSLKLKIFNGSTTINEDFTPQSFMMMTAETDGVMSISPPPPPSIPVRRLLELNSLPGGSYLRLKTRTSVRIPVSYLSVPTATLYSFTQAEREYQIWVKKTGGGADPVRQYVGPAPYAGIIDDEVKISFSIAATATSGVPAIKLQIKKPYDHTYTFQHAANVSTYEVTFDNHCNSEGCGSDFGYYYEILEAIHPTTLVSYEIEEFLDRRPASINGDSEASCNPVIGNPGGMDMGTWHTPNP